MKFAKGRRIALFKFDLLREALCSVFGGIRILD